MRRGANFDVQALEGMPKLFKKQIFAVNFKIFGNGAKSFFSLQKKDMGSDGMLLLDFFPCQTCLLPNTFHILFRRREPLQKLAKP